MNSTVYFNKLFYASGDWHRLLRNLISPFIKRNDLIGLEKNFFFFFSFDKGDHIKFFAYPNDPQFGNIYNDFSIELNDYLLQFPSENPSSITTPGECLWINYANNTVNDTHDSQSKQMLLRRRFFSLFNALSIYLLEVFDQEETSVDGIISIALFLQMKLAKILPAEFPSVIYSSIIRKVEINSEMNIRNINLMDQIYQNCIIDFDENAEDLYSYYEDTQLTEATAEREVILLNNLLEQCRAILKESTTQAAIENLVMLISLQLGLGSKQQIYLYTMIEIFFKKRDSSILMTV